MKKFAKVVALVLVVAMSLALLVSCGPNSDPDKAKEALKGNGYTATISKDAISLGITEALLGCERGDMIAIVTGTKKDDDKNLQTVTIYYFKDSATANKVWDKVKSESDKESKNNESDWTTAKVGAMIYYGTSAAIKAAK